MKKKFYFFFPSDGKYWERILKNFLNFILQIYLFLKRRICSKLNADDSEYVIKNGLFCYLAAHFIDLLDMQICKNMHLHKIVDPAYESKVFTIDRNTKHEICT